MLLMQQVTAETYTPEYITLTTYHSLYKIGPILTYGTNTPGHVYGLFCLTFLWENIQGYVRASTPYTSTESNTST